MLRRSRLIEEKGPFAEEVALAQVRKAGNTRAGGVCPALFDHVEGARRVAFLDDDGPGGRRNPFEAR